MYKTRITRLSHIRDLDVDLASAPLIGPCLGSGLTESHLSPNALAVSDHVMGRLTLFIVIITKKIDQLLLTSLLILCAENQNQTI